MTQRSPAGRSSGDRGSQLHDELLGARDTRQRLLDCAAETLRADGYAATTIERIAHAAGVRAPAAYYYFGSRDELIDEVIRAGGNQGLAALERTLAEAPPDADPLDKFGLLIDTQVREATTKRDYISARIRNLSQLPPERRARYLDDERAFFATWRSVVDDAIRAGSAVPSADAYPGLLLHLGSLNWTGEWVREGRPDVETVVRTAHILGIRGISAGRAPTRGTTTVQLPPHLDEPSVTDPKSMHTRARILRGAAHALATRQYARTRLSDIAAAAGLQYQALYYYYRTKELLIADVVRYGIRHILERAEGALAQLPESADGLTRFVVASRAHLETVLRDCPYALVAIQNLVRLPQDARAGLVDDQLSYEAFWRALVDQGAADGSISRDLDPECLVMLVVGGLDQVPTWWDRSRLDLAELVSSLLRYVERASRV